MVLGLAVLGLASFFVGQNRRGWIGGAARGQDVGEEVLIELGGELGVSAAAVQIHGGPDRTAFQLAGGAGADAAAGLALADGPQVGATTAVDGLVVGHSRLGFQACGAAWVLPQMGNGHGTLGETAAKGADESGNASRRRRGASIAIE